MAYKIKSKAKGKKTYYVSLFSPSKKLGEVYVEGKFPSGVKNYIYEINTPQKEKKLEKELIEREQNEYQSYTSKQKREYKKKYKETPAQYLVSLHKIPKKKVNDYKFLGSMG